MLCCVRSITDWQLLTPAPTVHCVSEEYKYQPNIPQHLTKSSYLHHVKQLLHQISGQISSSLNLGLLKLLTIKIMNIIKFLY